MRKQEIWDRSENTENEDAPLYIAVGGNTGSGKSTLIGEISREFSKHYGVRYFEVDERNFHHPLLTQMFFEPSQYALHVQLNFMLQRCAYIFHVLQNRLPSVMERCHFEDAIFIEDHYVQGNITKQEYRAYSKVREVLWAKIRAPDIYVRVLVEPNISIERIRRDEAEGKRPEEFPSDLAFCGYVERWYNAYKRFFNEMDDVTLESKLNTKAVYDVDPNKTPAESAADILSYFTIGGAGK